MKYLFFVQNNGRGHLAQALTLKEKLTSRGHEVLGAVVGSKNGSALPEFFKEQFVQPIYTVASPYFVTDKKNRGIKIMASIALSLSRLPKYRSSLKTIKNIIKDLKPDILINCYEPIAGTFYRLNKVSQPMYCLSHQYFISHPTFKYPRISWLARTSFKIYNSLTAPDSATKIALSFTKENDLPNNNLFVCPPLIRSAIKNSRPRNQDFILTYILNSGYGADIEAWCRNNPSYHVEAFRQQTEETKSVLNNLVFHALSGEKFIDRLINCGAYASTGGFESIAEASYLKKNILMVPTAGHFEQKCNVSDAQRAELVNVSETFDLSLLASRQTKTHSDGQLAFKKWVDNYEDKIINILEQKTK
jgi:uncharacterized protein (TIGR00661 family)